VSGVTTSQANAPTSTDIDIVTAVFARNGAVS